MYVFVSRECDIGLVTWYENPLINITLSSFKNIFDSFNVSNTTSTRTDITNSAIVHTIGRYFSTTRTATSKGFHRGRNPDTSRWWGVPLFWYSTDTDLYGNYPRHTLQLLFDFEEMLMRGEWRTTKCRWGVSSCRPNCPDLSKRHDNNSIGVLIELDVATVRFARRCNIFFVWCV